MLKKTCPFFGAMMMIVVTTVTGVSVAQTTHAVLRPVPFDKVKVTDKFWLPRIETNRKVTLPHNIKWCEDTGRISNFAKAGGLMKGEHEGIYFNDSDVYKVMEGAAYTLSLCPDKELEAKIDSIIDKIAAAQQPDGYINTHYTLKEPDKRWTNLSKMHELYCGGHMFEAAVAYHRATGKRKFLDVACKFADHIDSVFGPGKRIGYAGHEEIELALIKLYNETGNDRYRKLAEFFVEVRGQDRDTKQEYCQAHLPVKEQSEIVGHAVRAMYLYSGVADVAALTGDQGYIDAMERLWQNVTGRKMYVTGGIGAEAKHEGFSADFVLPNQTAYAETCAAIGMALWNHRLLMLHGQGRFGDVLERVIYNGMLSGVSLDGATFFYVNPLASNGKHNRQAWFGCACCPSNVVRFLPSLGGYIYAEGKNAAYVNLYVASTAEMTVADQKVQLTQKTDYPWSGKVSIAVDSEKPASFGLNLRIPGWAKSFQASVNGSPVTDAKTTDGYLTISREWKAGDTVQLDLPMEIVRVRAHPRVAADLGRVALQRGPVVYCLEGIDNGGNVRNLVLPPNAKMSSRFEPDLLNGVVTIEAQGMALQSAEPSGQLYRFGLRRAPATLKAVPYYAWNNRGPGQMAVWIPEAVGLAEVPMPSSKAQVAKAEASHCERRCSPAAVNDNQTPTGSDALDTPKFSWHPRRDSKEWISYKFDRPVILSSSEVYWLAGDKDGNYRLPVSWQLSWNRAGTWVPVEATADYPLRKDTFNRVTFKPVPTMEIRLEAQLPEDASSGILEWRVD